MVVAIFDILRESNCKSTRLANNVPKLYPFRMSFSVHCHFWTIELCALTSYSSQLTQQGLLFKVSVQQNFCSVRRLTTLLTEATISGPSRRKHLQVLIFRHAGDWICLFSIVNLKIHMLHQLVCLQVLLFSLYQLQRITMIKSRPQIMETLYWRLEYDQLQQARYTLLRDCFSAQRTPTRQL